MFKYFSILAFSCFAYILLISCTTNKKNEKMKAENKIVSYIQPDVYKTDMGDLKITLVGHASLIFEFNGKIIHVDPFSEIGDYSRLPKADLIILTHEHVDHLDPKAIDAIKKEDTKFIVSKACNEILGYGEIIQNNESTSFENIKIESVPAYNMFHKSADGIFYHPEGRGNGYIFSFGNLKVYVAGDTENIPEMEKLKGKIDIAFLPKNIPYTMDDDMFIDAARKVVPTYLYPYHMTEFNEDKIKPELDKNIQLIIKPMSNK